MEQSMHGLTENDTDRDNSLVGLPTLIEANGARPSLARTAPTAAFVSQLIAARDRLSPQRAVAGAQSTAPSAPMAKAPASPSAACPKATASRWWPELLVFQVWLSASTGAACSISSGALGMMRRMKTLKRSI